jgi:subtilisin family serine protease
LLSLRRRRPRRLLSFVVPLTAALAVVAVPPASADDGAADAVLRPAGVSGTPTATAPLTPTGYKAGRYVVVLRDPAAAGYQGGISGLAAVVGPRRTFAADAPRTRAYVDHLEKRQQEVAASVKATALTSYTLTTNGFAAKLSAKQASALAVDPRVSAVVKDELLHVQDASTSTGYLGLEGDDGVWSKVGGAANAGKGIVVGVVDTGIAPENPSFAGDPLGRVDGPAPFRDGSSIVFHKSDGTDFRGACVPGEQFPQSECSTKIIGARYFFDGFGRDGLGTAGTGEYLSARDGEAHGSHTASTAAGNADIATGGPHISGVTPAAKIAVYKACWSGPFPATQDDDGCATIDLLSAIDAAVEDGVDVINYSIGGGAAQTTNSLTDQAFMRAAAAGIFVAAAGGNAGPDVSTLDNASPWITTVAASTIPAPEGTVALGDGTKLLGATVTVPAAGVSGDLVDATDAGVDGASSPELCGAGTLDATKVTGKVVLCDRGVSDRLAKSKEVHRAGGIGMVLVNPTPDSTDVDAHAVPSIHLDAPSYDAVHTYAATANPTVTLERGNTTDGPSSPNPQIAGFSSRGPVEADGSDLIKPDIAAPGVNVLAATNNPQDGEPTWGYMSGTSMASPHVAGLAALYLGSKPNATPAEIKSALMTSATDTVDADGAPAEDPFAQGNGQVTPSGYLDPGLLYLNDVDDWEGYLAGIGQPAIGDPAPVDGSDLNLASIGVGALAGTQQVTRTVTATRAGTWTAEVTGLNGVTATVSPQTLTFGQPGEQHTYTVTFERDDAPLGEFSTGFLTWTGDDDTSVRDALAVRPVAFDAPKAVAGSGTTGSADVVARVGDDADVDLVAEGLAHGSRVSGTGDTGTAHRYAVTVPDGATFARFDLDATSDSADLDLMVYRKSPATGNVSLVTSAATGSADERADVRFPNAGTYIVEVRFLSGTDFGYALTSYVVDPSSSAGSFGVDPTTIHGTVGDTPTVTASWSSLEPGSYLGVVRYGDTGVSTVVTVDAGDDVPATPGTPTLSLDPDQTGWVGAGSDLRVTATGLTPGATYSAAVDGEEPLRTGTAAADGRVDWMVTMTADITPGQHTLSLTGPGADLSAAFRVTPVNVVAAQAFPLTAFNGKPYGRIDITYAGIGDLRYTIKSATSDEVFATNTEHVGMVVGLPTWSMSTPVTAVDGPFVGVVTVVLPDGSDGPSYTTEPGTPDEFEPGRITLTPQSADPDLVDVDIESHSWVGYTARVRYTGCDGRMTVAAQYLAEQGSVIAGATHQVWNLTGYTKLELVDSFGQVLLRYANNAPGRCDTAGIDVSQDMWATVTPTPTSSPQYDAQRPLTFQFNYRYPAGIKGFDLYVGEGDLTDGTDFFHEAIGVEKVTKPGPVVTRTLNVAEGKGTYATTEWEAFIDPPGIFASGTVSVAVPPLTRAALTPPKPTAPATLVAATPQVVGRAAVGRTVRAAAGAWRPSGVKLTYQWLRDGVAIGGARAATYRLAAADAGHRVSVRVTGTIGTQTASRTSVAVPVLRSLTKAPRPRITGKAVAGHRLAVHTGKWRPGKVRLSVVWYRDGHRVGTGLHYKLRRADRHHRIQVVVTGRRAGYEALTRASVVRRVR